MEAKEGKVNRLEWQRRRVVWRDREISERSGDMDGARAQIQVAITEQAIRELYDRVEALEKKREK